MQTRSQHLPAILCWSVFLGWPTAGPWSAVAQETVNAQPQLELRVPERLNGPLGACDSTDVKCCAGDHGRVAVVWPEDRSNPFAGSRMAILGDSAEATLPDKAYPTNIVALAFTSGKWYGLVNVGTTQAKQGIESTKSGAALLALGPGGWEQAELVMPGIVVARPGASGVSAFGHDDSIDVFWLDRYLPPLAFPDSGLDRERMWHAHVHPGQLATAKKIWDLPGPHSYCEDPIYLRIGSDRYDLLYTRLSYGLPRSVSRDLMYLRNALRPGLGGPQQSACLEYSCCEAVALPERRVAAMWLRAEHKESWKKPTALFETTFEDGREVRSTEVARGINWGGLALARVDLDDQAGVVALWSGRDSRLAYCIRLDPGDWTAPVETQLEIGRRNWLVSTDNGLVFVTERRSQLYWARLQLHRH
jgi:hypothetical protein